MGRSALSNVRQQAEEIAARLLGSCDDTPDEVFTVKGLADELDDIVGKCEECDWWVEAGDLNDDYICKECADG